MALADPRLIMARPFCDCLSATTVLLNTTGVPFWYCLQQQQRFEHQPLGGLQDLGEKDNMMPMILIEDVSTLLLLLLLLIEDCCWSAFRCCVVVCIMSQLPLPLSDCVPVVVVAAAVVFRLHLEGRTSW